MTRSDTDAPDSPRDSWDDLAVEIGQALRAAEQALSPDEEASPQPTRTGASRTAPREIEAALRRLVEAINAIIDQTNRATDAPLTPTETTFLQEAGIDFSVFGTDARQRADDWLIVSAIRHHAQAALMEQMEGIAAVDVLPELHAVVRALPDTASDLDRFRFLRTRHEDLHGMTPLRWLLLGGDPDMVIELARGGEAGEHTRRALRSLGEEYSSYYGPGYLDEVREGWDD